MYVSERHEANMCGPLQTAYPTAFRAGILAIVHAFQSVAIPFIVYTDCKGVAKLVNDILDDLQVDPRHPHFDLLEKLQQLHSESKQRRVVRLMPAHMDETSNCNKRAKYLREGRKMEHIHGNVAADELAKMGAGTNNIADLKYFLYTIRESITRTVQNYYVDVWRAETQRREQQDIDNAIFDEEARQIQNIAGED